MDTDEILVFIGSATFAGWATVRWYGRLLSAEPPYCAATSRVRMTLAVLPIGLLTVLAWALRVGAAREVREDLTYTLLFLGLGATWLALSVKATTWLGIDFWDDALERNNLAACVAVCGALIGSATVYVFANFGEGPTIWTTIGPATLASLTALALAATYQILSGAADAITIDRDLASGIRFAGLALASGLILGRSVAGDYATASSTLRDFFSDAWPAPLLVAVAILLERRLRPSRRTPRPDALRNGMLPSLAYLAVGVVDLIHLGPWAAPHPPG